MTGADAAADRVRRADIAEAGRLADLMAAAFQDDPVSGWLFPDPADRRRRQPDFFRIFLDDAFARGQVYTTVDLAGVTLWLDVAPEPGDPEPGAGAEPGAGTQPGQHGAEPGQRGAEPGAGGAGPGRGGDADPPRHDGHDGHDGHDARIAATCGPNHERFTILGGLMAASHPDAAAHAYLPFIAVAPGRQGHGVGAALLRHRFGQLDRTGRPAYLEASNERSRQLYERLGFRRLATRLDLPAGPSLYPMWRDANGG